MGREQRKEKMVEEIIENSLWRINYFEVCNGQNSVRNHLI